MSFIQIDNVSFRYRPAMRPVLEDLSLSIEKGSYTAILGHNGSGKSTLAKLICGILTPGEGKITVAGIDTAEEETLPTLRKTCGMIFQNPDNQLVAGIVEEDVAFAPENLGVPREEIRRRVDEALETVGMTEYARHSTAKLSGGQKQRVAIAGVLAMQPDCILFDEATAMLDPTGRRDIIAAMKKLNREKNITVITITHYMAEAIEADRVLVLDHGKLLMDGPPRDIFSRVRELQAVSLSVPQVTELLHLLSEDGHPFPKGILHAMEAADALEAVLPAQTLPAEAVVPEAPAAPEGTSALELQDVTVVYSEKTPFRKEALSHLSVTFPRGEVIGIIGHTGSGKSTLATLLNGLRKPTEGKVLLNGGDLWAKPKEMRKIRSRVGLVFQYPEYQLFEETVEADIAFGPRNMALPEEEIARRVKDAAAFCGLSGEELRKSPFELSGGQKRRAAIAGVVAMEPEVLVLDEPAAGLDPKGREEIFGGLMEYRERTGATLLLISHSMEEVARYADRILVLKDGKLCLYGTVREVFGQAEKLLDASLDLPQITKLFLELKKRSLCAGTDVYTVRYAQKLLGRMLTC